MKINPVKTIILITSTLFITSIYFNCPARATSWQKTTPAYLRGNWEEFPKHGHAEFLTIKRHYIYAGTTQSDVYPYKILKTRKKGSKFFIKGYMSMGHTHTTFKIKKISSKKIISIEDRNHQTIMHKVKHIIQFW